MVVIAPFPIEPHPNVVYVKESNPRGYYWAISDALEFASGKYIIHIADDCRATPFWASKMIEFMTPHDNEIFEVVTGISISMVKEPPRGITKQVESSVYL